MNPSPEYLAALEASRAATQAYYAARDAYRAGMMSDADFLAACAADDAATEAFDRAYASEVARA